MAADLQNVLESASNAVDVNFDGPLTEFSQERRRLSGFNFPATLCNEHRMGHLNGPDERRPAGIAFLEPLEDSL